MGRYLSGPARLRRPGYGFEREQVGGVGDRFGTGIEQFQPGREEIAFLLEGIEPLVQHVAIFRIELESRFQMGFCLLAVILLIIDPAEQNVGALDIADRAYVIEKGRVAREDQGAALDQTRADLARAYLGGHKAVEEAKR